MNERLEQAETVVLAGIGLLRGVCELVYYETVGRHRFEVSEGCSLRILEGGLETPPEPTEPNINQVDNRKAA